MFSIVNKQGKISYMSVLHFILRAIYRGVAWTGFFSSKIGRRAYEFVFCKFRLLTEGSTLRTVCSFIKPGSFVIDVGANIGFCTKFFLESAGPKGKVVAIEPERSNLKSLHQRFSAEIKSAQLEVIGKVVADKGGDYYLQIDPCNPGGHTIGPNGVPVKGTTIDEVVADKGIGPSFIKIDVEGFEESVILGAEKTIADYKPAIFMEFHPAFLLDCGTEPAELLKKLTDAGYALFLVEGKGRLNRYSIEEIIEKSHARHWNDILAVL